MVQEDPKDQECSDNKQQTALNGEKITETNGEKETETNGGKQAETNGGKQAETNGGRDAVFQRGEQETEKRMGMLYTLTQSPPWYLCILLGFQVRMTSLYICLNPDHFLSFF